MPQYARLRGRNSTADHGGYCFDELVADLLGNFTSAIGRLSDVQTRGAAHWQPLYGNAWIGLNNF